MKTLGHEPVLFADVVRELEPTPGDLVVDATVGLAGHAIALWAAIQPGGRLLGIDQDPSALDVARHRLPDDVTLVHGNFRQLDEIVRQHGWSHVDRLLLDLGVSSPQLDRPERGFSFRHEGPLDMRMNPEAVLRAEEIVNHWPAEDLVRILREYGEERFARRVAAHIVRHRPLRSTKELRAVVASAMPGKQQGGHPARRTFQALRIAVNDELAALQEALDAAARIVRPGGRVAVISFHSLEDRLVKQRFRLPPFEQTTKKPIQALPEERQQNPRSRSAKLRVASVLDRIQEA